MDVRSVAWSLVRDRFRGSAYVFLGGLVVGIFLGWLGHGVVSFVVRFGLLLLLLTPLVVVFLVWRRMSDRGRRRYDVVPNGSYVVETRAELRER